MTPQTLSDAPSGVSTSSPSTLLAKPDAIPTSVESVRQGGEDIFRHHQITVHNADCMDVMARFPDKYFELAIVDPPYGIDVANNTTGTVIRNKSDKDVLQVKEWDKAIPDAKYFVELRRVSKEQIVWGGNYFLDYLGYCKAPIIWDKLNGGNLYADGELAWTSKGLPKNLKIWKHQWCGAFKDSERSTLKFHPTQKPRALYDWLLANYAKPGWKILDTHGGSLSSAIACHYAGNPLVACELDTDYFREACARLVRETAQAELPVITQPQHEQTELI